MPLYARVCALNWPEGNADAHPESLEFGVGTGPTWVFVEGESESGSSRLPKREVGTAELRHCAANQAAYRRGMTVLVRLLQFLLAVFALLTAAQLVMTLGADIVGPAEQVALRVIAGASPVGLPRSSAPRAEACRSAPALSFARNVRLLAASRQRG